MQEVKSTGRRVRIKALQYSTRPERGLSFKWSKYGYDEGTENELKLECVTSDDCKGYYTCEILKDDKPFFSVYHCLRTTGRFKLHCIHYMKHLWLQENQQSLLKTSYWMM